MDRGTGPGYVYAGCRPGEGGREVKKRGNQRGTHAHAPVGVGDGGVGWYLFGLK